MHPTRQLTVFAAFLAVLTLTGGLLLALEPEPLAPTAPAPTLVMATGTEHGTDQPTDASALGETVTARPASGHLGSERSDVTTATE